MSDPKTARDVMTARPVTLREDATIGDVLGILAETGFGAIPVVNRTGRLLGLVARSGLLAYFRTRLGESLKGESSSLAGEVDATAVGEWMNREVYCIAPEASLTTVIEEMLARKVHRLYVVDEGQSLVGVVTSNDLLASLGGNS